MTTNVYVLQVIDTGEIIYSGGSQLSLLEWHKRTEVKVLKSKKRAVRFKQAIKNKNTIAGWKNYDEQIKTVTDKVHLIEFVFSGYNQFFEKRLDKQKKLC